MISIKEALAIVLAQDAPKLQTRKSVNEALGYNLAGDITSPLDLPSFDNSAMDGYAVCGYDETFTLKGEIAAGSTTENELSEGEAMRIFTGGKVPKNATAVIMQEKTKTQGKLLNISDEVVKGKNIRLTGEEIKKGHKVFESGQHVTPATIGILNSLGFQEIDVFEKPRISMITTGNELINPGTPLEEGQIYESNGPTMIAALNQFGFECQAHTQIKDDFDAIKWTIGEQLDQSDLLLISGGISVGDYDFVKQALIENGVAECFYKVDQKPGKPLFFGRRNNAFVFGLPGNPASGLTCFYIYVLPLLQQLAGAKKVGLNQIKLPIAHDFIIKSDRPTFYKALIEDGKVSLLDGQSSSMLHSLALGNAIVFLDAPKIIEKEDLVDCYML
ncbi:MAG: molybdopterin molybdotransferase [Cyclobacteriaceae bacterium]|jgi:molybdopterin molybdotransferase